MSKKITDLSAATSLTGNELVELSQLSTTVVYTATTISADGDDNSYNDSANQFVAEGFAIGQRVNVVGFTGNVANNIFVGVITALTAGKMTIGGTDGDVIVDDAAGESVTITKWNSARTTLTAIAALASGGGGDYRVGFQMITAASASEVIVDHVFTEAVTLPANFAGSEFNVGTNPAATFDFDVQLNGVSVGTISVSSGGVVTASTTGGALVVASGDVLSIIADSGVDTLARFSGTLKGTY